MPAPPRLEDLRRYAVARSLFTPTTLAGAITKLGFVQADPIRAPARAQDLILRHRVKDYRAGDLERRYARLQVEEDFLVNYGFLPRPLLALLHPRQVKAAWDGQTRRRANAVLAFVREHGAVHPRQVEQHFAHGRVRNYWGGSSNATTQLLDGLHYRGLLRVKRRDSGTRVYEAVAHAPADDAPAARAERAAALLDLVVRKYAPLPAASLGYLARLLGGGAPHLSDELRDALRLARERLAQVRIDGTDWYWPADEYPRARRYRFDEQLRLLAPFDPIVWDRRRFSLFWDWTYKFEAYTPAARRQFGYYALPMLWRGQVIGWANLTWREGQLEAATGYAAGTAPSEAAFGQALDEELARMRQFLAPR
ncbi:crosslink repair DNA glycosylase YcaQ family protein [Pseudoxanthomonas sp. USHLN014]|uniref:DNA glycosylase AlkZ-like family protein n=1 Tax=Pseudoxanthomonas sp. USHLN014 TaxID=3081297 RepID=UPI00301D2F0F